MFRFVRALSLSLPVLAGSLMVLLASIAQAQAPPCPITADSNVTTGHNDTCRTGWQQNETILTPSTVSQSTFGLLWQYPVNGAVFAQPLAYHAGAGTRIGSGTTTCSNCDVVFIADEQNYVYAYEADPSSQQLLWSTRLGDDLPCVSPTLPLPCGAGVINPAMGITSTPVIDEYNQVIYAAGLDAVDSPTQYYLAAINLLDGAVLSKVTISASFSPAVSPGKSSICTAGSGSGTVYFDSTQLIQRAGLLLIGNALGGTYGTVYISFAPAGSEWENGWMLGYQYSSGGGISSLPVYVLNTTPYGTGGGMWEGGDGLVAADATVSGHTATYIFAPTGNGTFGSAQNNYGDSLLRLTTGLAISDFFTPADEFTYNSNQGRCAADIDLDSGGLIALPDETPPLLTGHPRLMVAADKEAVLYVVDRDNLTQHHTPTDLIVQNIQAPNKTNYPNVWGYWGYPAYYKWTSGGTTYRALYYSAREFDALKAPLPINQYMLTTTGPIPGSSLDTPELFCNYGAVPSVSSNGSTGGILWAIEATNIQNPGNGNPSCPSGNIEPGTDYLDIALHAYDATHISNTIPLYNGRGHNSSPHTGYPIKFTTPTVFNGKVFAGARNETNTGGIVDVWGLCSETPSQMCLE
jgi:hypothetical protein